MALKVIDFRQSGKSFEQYKSNEYLAPRIANVFIARSSNQTQIGACWLRYSGDGIFLPVQELDLENPNCEPAVVAPCAIINDNHMSSLRDRNINILYFRDTLYAHIMNIDCISMINCQKSKDKILDAICNGKINFGYPRQIRITAVLNELGDLWDG